MVECGMLKGKTILLGVSGSIAAYKAASLVSLLVKNSADVHVIMTRNAVNFINPITFETLTGNRCLTDTFDRNFEFKVGHVSLAKKADLLMIAPATANVIAKISNGLCDDMLTTTFLACRCPKLIAPAMNTAMWENAVTQDNIKKCSQYGMRIISPAEGHLACGDTGAGKMAEPEVLFRWIVSEAGYKKDLSGKRILVTAGPTRESLDPVRFISNHSSGKMGYALAQVAAYRGADVVLVSGPVSLEEPEGVRTVRVETAAQMFDAVKEYAPGSDIIIKAAAVADYAPLNVSGQKIKKSDGDISVTLRRTDDILAYLGGHKRDGQIICGFSMETENLIENSRAKLVRKNADMIVANNLTVPGAGFCGDTNVVTIITKNAQTELPLMTKNQVAEKILDAALDLHAGRGMSGDK